MIKRITIEQYGRYGQYITLYVNGKLHSGDLTKEGLVQEIIKILA